MTNTMKQAAKAFEVVAYAIDPDHDLVTVEVATTEIVQTPSGKSNRQRAMHTWTERCGRRARRCRAWR